MNTTQSTLPVSNCQSRVSRVIGPLGEKEKNLSFFVHLEERVDIRGGGGYLRIREYPRFKRRASEFRI